MLLLPMYTKKRTKTYRFRLHGIDGDRRQGHEAGTDGDRDRGGIDRDRRQGQPGAGDRDRRQGQEAGTDRARDRRPCIQTGRPNRHAKGARCVPLRTTNPEKQGGGGTWEARGGGWVPLDGLLGFLLKASLRPAPRLCVTR